MKTSANKIPIQNRVASIFVHVTDLRRAAEWYSELLGLPVKEERLNGGPVYWFDIPGTGLILDNNANNRLNPDWREEMKPLIMFSCEDIDEAYAYVTEHGEPLMKPEHHPGMAYFNFLDPDGRAYMVCWSNGVAGSELDESNEPLTTSPIRPRIGGVFVNVRNMKSAAKWISGLLGLACREEDTIQSIYTVPTTTGAAILLDDNRFRQGENYEIPFMFACDDIEAAFQYVSEKGMDVFHGIEGIGVKFFTLRDPDNNLVMVCQDGEEPSGIIDGYTLVQLPVRDLPRAVSFYRDVLGFILEHPERPIEEHAFLRTLSGQGPGLHLLEVESDEYKHDHWYRGEQPVHGLELHSRDVRALHRRLVRAGIRIEAEPYFVEPCGGYVKFYDPDGHLICVNQS
ncbi:VOC family protein [Paenibacillus eucommiae]|uniref:Enzyme related to lactoylglutathione lyase n=1 Tax=Paenibacillus eucommiae TaxID=1355755 RepID=A0ABS4IQR1_9BACL|nr:VOC family protein [Paenibacillus eucommiae]MBP1989326.1 putative enzyme related to lactoylglutathione lyase [Paenibacillus eucommiae]